MAGITDPAWLRFALGTSGAMSGPYTVKHLVAAGALTVAVFASVLAFMAIRSQATGTAVYWTGWDSEQRHEVKRDISRLEFRSVVRSTWEASACCFIVAVAGFVVYRRLAADE